MTDHDRTELTAVLAKIGITEPLPSSVDWPVFEGDYVKFMGGFVYDKAACDQLEAWLVQRGYSYERHRDRAIRCIDRRAVLEMAQAFGWDNEEILENFGQTTRSDDYEWFQSVLAAAATLPPRQAWAAPVASPRPFIPCDSQ